MKIEVSHSEATQYRNSLTANAARTPLREIKKTLPLRVLSEKHFQQWQTFGFTVIKQAVPVENV